MEVGQDLGDDGVVLDGADVLGQRVDGQGQQLAPLLGGCRLRVATGVVGGAAPSDCAAGRFGGNAQGLVLRGYRTCLLWGPSHVGSPHSKGKQSLACVAFFVVSLCLTDVGGPGSILDCSTDLTEQ